MSSVAGGTVVTLTATVQAGATALKLGQVNFCDAPAASCTDIHLVGTAQLTSAGSAVLRFRPGPGSHSYKAVFLGTLDTAASVSAAVGLTVGPRPPGLQTTYTVASVAGPDATNMYTLTANVGTKGAISPSGTVSFLDTNNANSLLGTGTLLREPLGRIVGSSDICFSVLSWRCHGGRLHSSSRFCLHPRYRSVVTTRDIQATSIMIGVRLNNFRTVRGSILADHL